MEVVAFIAALLLGIPLLAVYVAFTNNPPREPSEYDRQTQQEHDDSGAFWGGV